MDRGQLYFDPFGTLPALSAAETAIIIMGGIMVLAAECMNTAIERVVDDIGMERRDLAKQAKDAGSAAVRHSNIRRRGLGHNFVHDFFVKVARLTGLEPRPRRDRPVL